MRKTNAEYIAKAREARLGQGMKRVEVWIPRESEHLLKAYAEKLRAKRKP